MKASAENKRTWPIFSLVVLFILAGINIFLPLFIVPKFEQIYMDALGPDHPLPELTLFIIGARIPLVLIAMAWPVAVIVAIWKRSRATFWILNLGYLYFASLIVISVVALFMPMVGTLITGLPESSLSIAEASR